MYELADMKGYISGTVRHPFGKGKLPVVTPEAPPKCIQQWTSNKVSGIWKQIQTKG